MGTPDLLKGRSMELWGWQVPNLQVGWQAGGPRAELPLSLKGLLPEPLFLEAGQSVSRKAPY